MRAAGFFAQERGLGDEAGRVDHVALFGRTRREAVGDLGETGDGGAEAEAMRRSMDAACSPRAWPRRRRRMAR